MFTGPEIRSGELWAFSDAKDNCCGRWKSAEIEAKSLVISAGSSDAFTADKERK